MGQHAAAGLDQAGTECAHVAVRGQVFFGDRLRFSLQQRLPVGTGSPQATPHACQRPGQVHRGRARGVQPLQRRLQLLQGMGAIGRLHITCGQHHTPGGSDADGRRAAHGQGVDGGGHLITVMAGHMLDHERQLALVKQLQGIAGPQDRADVVVAGVVEVGGSVHGPIVGPRHARMDPSGFSSPRIRRGSRRRPRCRCGSSPRCCLPRTGCWKAGWR
ncbi:hypothetical protein D3C72_1438480 [compost metagenome]